MVWGLVQTARQSQKRSRILSRLRGICSIAFLLVVVTPPMAAQQWIKVSPETAASHLVKKVEPVYPAFAKAAGVQGAVCLHVGIGLAGTIGFFGEMDGPPSLYQAAQDAVRQYVWKPFEKDGRPVAAETTVTVVFKLEGNVPPPPPPPNISSASLKGFERFVRPEHWDSHTPRYKCPDCVVNISRKLRKWLAADLKTQLEDLEDGSESSPEFSSLDAQLKDLDGPLPLAIEVIEVPIQKPDQHLYLFRIHSEALCGTGGCPIELIEEDSNGIRRVVGSFGGGYSIHPRSSSPYPDIFIYSHMNATEINVAGYSNVSGLWGQLYCGEITSGGDSREERDDIHVCR